MIPYIESSYTEKFIKASLNLFLNSQKRFLLGFLVFLIGLKTVDTLTQAALFQLLAFRDLLKRFSQEFGQLRS